MPRPTPVPTPSDRSRSVSDASSEPSAPPALGRDPSAPDDDPSPGGPRARAAILVVVAGSLFVDMVVYGLVVPFLPLHAAGMGLSDTDTGVLFASYAAALLATSWLIARTLPRLDPRAVLVCGLAGLCLATGAFWAADDYAGLLLARMAQGAAAAAPWTMGPALVAEWFPPGRRGRAMGILSAGSALGTLVGPPLGGSLYALGGYDLPFVVVMVATGVLAIGAALLLLRVPGLSRDDPDAAVGVAQVVRFPAVARICVVVVCGAALLSMLEPVVPLYLARHFGAGPLANGWLFGVAVLAYAIAAPLAGRWSDRVGREPVCAAGLASCVATLPALALAPSLPWAGVALGAIGLSLALVLTPCMPALADAVDLLRAELAAARATQRPSYATVYIAFNAAYGLGMLAGPIAGAWLADLTDSRVALAAFGGLAACVAFGLTTSRGR